MKMMAVWAVALSNTDRSIDLIAVLSLKPKLEIGSAHLGKQLCRNSCSVLPIQAVKKTVLKLSLNSGF